MHTYLVHFFNPCDRAAASLFEIVKAGESLLKRAKWAKERNDGNDSSDATHARFILSALDRIDRVFGIFYEPFGFEPPSGDSGAGDDGEGAEKGDLSEAMVDLLARRLAARESKDWATADAVRDEIKALGYAVKVRRRSIRRTQLEKLSSSLLVPS